MNCKDCKALQRFRCVVLGTMRDDWQECPIDDWARKRDEINDSDRGEVHYECVDDPNEGISDCLYGGKEHPESDCSHLETGGHPKDCGKSRLKEG